MVDDNDDRPEYDPSEPTPPGREPPYRQTAPQSEFTGAQVAVGLGVSLLGLVVIFGLPLVLA